MSTLESMSRRCWEMDPQLPTMGHMGRQTLRMEIMVNRWPNPSSFRSLELQMDQSSGPVQEKAVMCPSLRSNVAFRFVYV